MALDETQLTFGTIVTLLIGGISWLASSFKSQLADKDRQIAAERERTEAVRVAAVTREAALQEKLDQLINRLIEAAGLLEKGTRQIRR
jgi:hypothetical protein